MHILVKHFFNFVAKNRLSILAIKKGYNLQFTQVYVKFLKVYSVIFIILNTIFTVVLNKYNFHLQKLKFTFLKTTSELGISGYTE